MKKTVSMLLAIIIAAIAICTFATTAFANPDATTTTTVANNGITDPNDGRLEVTTTTKPTTTTTTKPSTTTTTAAPSTTTTTAAPVSSTSTEASTSETVAVSKETTTEKIHTRPAGVTVIDEGTTKAPATTKPATTKKPAANVSAIPNTGSSAVAPVIALLALAAGTVAVVKTKKED